ncbi:MAG TPA: VOC family protein [Povalibacter sp.]|uniref:VOC family protein n=1 Tax=Povalibacter sp. TaxID=1962978 RepID=UPI002CD26E1C|nr:VOC family protein [Povalibacter sp.]HMN43023.1 VOC family protein [Povalibacter sp.]
MPVTGPLWFALEVPSLDEGIKFYTDAGLEASRNGNIAQLTCIGQSRPSAILIGGAPRKRLHHIALRATDLPQIAASVPAAGGKVVAAPAGFDAEGLWVTDPHGVLYHLLERPEDAPLAASDPYQINAPGRIVRNRRAGMQPIGQYAPVKPLRLGHVMMFSPDVLASAKFVTEGLGMGLADRAEDVVAFCCARRNSDHHVLGFGKSNGIGMHHASFQVRDPDDVGRAGRALLEKTGRGDWGFGRHTVGSNYFHYIQDPWGSWLEYYSDMDFIDDYALWTPTNYGPEDSMANWAPPLPPDFVVNQEAEQAG